MAPKASAAMRKRPAAVVAAIAAQPHLEDDNDGEGPSVTEKKPENKQSAQKSLEQKVREFVQLINQKKLSMTPASLKSFFTSSEMSSLWQKLKTQRKKEDMSINEAWEELCRLGKGKGMEEKKTGTLLAFIVGGELSWKAHLVAEVEKIKQTDKAGEHKQLYYKGELERIHGEEECEKFIKMGKFREVKDRWGDTAYIKSTLYETKENEHSKSAQIERSSKLAVEDFDDQRSAFKQWFGEQDSGLMKLEKSTTKKRPAAAMLPSGSGSSSSAAGAFAIEDEEKPKDKLSLVQKSMKAAKAALNAGQKLVLKLLDHHSRCKGDHLSKATKDELKVAASEVEGLVKALRLEVAKRNPEQKKMASLTLDVARLQKRSVMLFANKHFFLAKA